MWKLRAFHTRHSLLLITQTEINILQKKKLKQFHSLKSHGNPAGVSAPSTPLVRFEEANLGTSKNLQRNSLEIYTSCLVNWELRPQTILSFIQHDRGQCLQAPPNPRKHQSTQSSTGERAVTLDSTAFWQVPMTTFVFLIKYLVHIK